MRRYSGLKMRRKGEIVEGKGKRNIAKSVGVLSRKRQRKRDGNAGCLFLCDSLHFLLLFPFSVPSQNRVYFAPSMPGFASGSNAARSRPLGDKLGDAGRIEILKNARGFRGDKVIFAARATNLPRNIPLIIPTACLPACLPASLPA